MRSLHNGDDCPCSASPVACSTLTGSHRLHPILHLLYIVSRPLLIFLNLFSLGIKIFVNSLRYRFDNGDFRHSVKMSEGGDAASGGGFAPSYSWIGAPTQFNGTNTLTGGDSCQFHSLPWEIAWWRSIRSC